MEAALALGGATNLLTEIIIALISIAKTAIRCQAECRKLQVKLEAIQPDVEVIERQLHELQENDPNAKQDLQLVDKWLSELKQELHVASTTVHKCNSGSRIGRHYNVVKNYNLKTKITAQCEKITRLADQRVSINLHLVNMRKGESSSHNEGAREFQKWNSEKNAIVNREEFTRLSERERQNAQFCAPASLAMAQNSPLIIFTSTIHGPRWGCS